MICFVTDRTTHADYLYDATVGCGENTRPDRPLGRQVIGHWPVLDELSDQHNVWPAENWIRYLEVPLQDWPDAVGPRGNDDRAAIFHFLVHPHPADRILTDAEWTAIVHHLACAAGITTSNGDGEYRWVAVRTAPRQVEFIANLINDSDGTWAPVPEQLRERTLSAVRDCETQLGLVGARPEPAFRVSDVAVHRDRKRGITVTVHTHRTQVIADVEDAGFTIQNDQRYVLPAGTPPDEAKQRAAELVKDLRADGVTVLLDPAVHRDAEGAPCPDVAPTGTASLTGQVPNAHQPAQLAGLISAITDDRLGDLPRLRRFAESAAAWAGARTGPAAGDIEHRMGWIARRLHGIEEDLHDVAQTLTEQPAAPRPAAVPPLVISPAAPAPRPHGPVR